MQLLSARNKKMWLGLANSKGISSPKLSLALHRDRCQVWEGCWLSLIITASNKYAAYFRNSDWESGLVIRFLRFLEGKFLEEPKKAWSFKAWIFHIHFAQHHLPVLLRRISSKRTIRVSTDPIYQYLKTRWIIPGWGPWKTCNLSQLRMSPVTSQVAMYQTRTHYCLYSPVE